MARTCGAATIEFMQFVASLNARRRLSCQDADCDELEPVSVEFVAQLTALSQTCRQLLDAVETPRRDPRSAQPAAASGLVAQLERIENIAVRVRALAMSDPPLRMTRQLRAFGCDAIEAGISTLVLLGGRPPHWATCSRQLDLAASRARCFVELMRELSDGDLARAGRLVALRDAFTELGECVAELTLAVSAD